MKADQERVSKLLTDTVTLLCKNGLIYKEEIKIQGVLGITLDKNDVFIVHINETLGTTSLKDSQSSDGSGKKATGSGVAVVDLTRTADTPMMPTQMRGMGLVPGMPPSGVGVGGGMNSRKQRPVMPQMLSRNQYMPHLPRFRIGIPPVSLQAMASQMNNHMIYSRQQQQQGGLATMPQPTRHRILHPSTSSRRQTVQPPASVSIDDDEDVVIIGTGHEEPSPNWNSPCRRNQQNRTNNQQVLSVSHTKSTNISHMSSVSNLSVNSSAEVDQLPVTVTLSENISETHNDVASSMNEPSIDCQKQPKMIEIFNNTLEEDQAVESDEIAPVTTAMLIEPTDSMSDGEALRGDLMETDEQQNQILSTNSIKECASEVRLDAKVGQNLSLEHQLSVPAVEVSSRIAAKESDEFDNPSDCMLTTQEQSICGSGETVLPVVYTDIADDPQPLHFDGNHVNDMDIQTLSFDILTEDDHDVSQSSSQISPWICKFPGCNASCTAASDLATHYTVRHVELLNLAQVSCSHTSAADSMSEGSEGGSCDGTGRKKVQKMMCCPFSGCQNKFSSWPGLNLHHKKVHGTPLSPQERREIVALYGKPFKCMVTPDCQKSYMTKRELGRHISKVHDAQDGSDSSCCSIPSTSAPASDTGHGLDPKSPSNAKNFLCLFNQCEYFCSSREALVEHLVTCHGSVTGSELSAGVKEETTEGQ